MNVRISSTRNIKYAVQCALGRTRVRFSVSVRVGIRVRVRVWVSAELVRGDQY